MNKHTKNKKQNNKKKPSNKQIKLYIKTKIAIKSLKTSPNPTLMLFPFVTFRSLFPETYQVKQKTVAQRIKKVEERVGREKETGVKSEI